METNPSNTTTTSMNTGVPNYKVNSGKIDEVGPQKETYWYNSNWATYLGYLKNIPEYKDNPF